MLGQLLLKRSSRARSPWLRSVPRTTRPALRPLASARDDASKQPRAVDDLEGASRYTLSAVVARYAEVQERLVPWFLREMPEVYFKLVPEATRLAHLQAAAGVFDPDAGRPAAVEEVRCATRDDGTVTYLVAGNAPGTLARQVRDIAPRELRTVGVYTSADEALCLNVFTLADTAAPAAADEAALAPHLAFAAAAPAGGAFWSEAAVRRHAARCSAEYVAGTRPERWARQRELFESVAGTQDVAAAVDPALEEAGAWLTVCAPDVLTASFLHKVCRVLGAFRLDIKRVHLDMVDDCAMLRLLAAPADGDVDWQAVAGLARRVKWLDETALDLCVDGKAPTAAAVAEAEVAAALGSLAHRTLARRDALAFARDRCHDVLKRHADLASEAARLLVSGGDEGELLRRVEAATAADDASRVVLAEVVRQAASCEASNVAREDRHALALVLDPGALPELEAVPWRVVFVHGRRFDGFHARFRPVARGGVRLVTPASPEALAHASARHYDECVGLAHAQQLKNKDIPEGGSKAVVLIDATNDDLGRAPAEFRDYLCRKAVGAFADALLDVSLEAEAPLPYLGPDEQVIPRDIEAIVENAARRGHPRPGAFMSSKPGAGINHKEYGVTSEGVVVFVDRALKEIGVDAAADPFRVSLAGGPDGDVGGNLLKILDRDWPHAAVVGVADGSGVAEDPAGLDRDELMRLVEAGDPIACYAGSFGPGGSLRAADDAEGAALRDTMHARVDAEVFIPCGGRPGTLNAGNVKDFFKPGDDAAPGPPRAPIVVEGANLFVTPEARAALHAGGVLCVKDSSANKCGVICSSFEILAAHLLDAEAFEAKKDVIVSEVLERLRELARLEADLLFREHRRFPGALPDFSRRISEAANAVADAVSEATSDDHAQELFAALAPDHLPPTLAALAVADPGALPAGYVKACAGAFLATRLVYGEGLTYVEALGRERLASAALAYLESEWDAAHARDAVAASDLDEATKAAVSGLLRPRVA